MCNTVSVEFLFLVIVEIYEREVDNLILYILNFYLTIDVICVYVSDIVDSNAEQKIKNILYN